MADSVDTSDIDKLLGIEVPLVPLSQSFVKNWWDYKLGKYCGERLYRCDILKEAEFKPSEIMMLGHRFEYDCTGVLSREGTIPERLCQKNGKPTAKMAAMELQAERFKKLVKKEKIDIQEVGEVLIHNDYDLGFRLKGVLDVRAVIEGHMAILDIKSSGLMGDRGEWNAMGWHAATFNQKDKLTIQVIAYKYLAWKVMGIRDMPFYYAIHSNANSVDSFYWEVRVKDFDVAMSHFEDTLATVADSIRSDTEFGFTPYPNVKDCSECPLTLENKPCAHRVDTPEKQIITIDGVYHNDTEIGDL